MSIAPGTRRPEKWVACATTSVRTRVVPRPSSNVPGGNSGPSSTTATAGTTPPVVGARSLAISVSSESAANRWSQNAVFGNVSGSIASTVTSSGWSATLPYR